VGYWAAVVFSFDFTSGGGMVLSQLLIWWSYVPVTLALLGELWSCNTRLYGGAMVLKHSPLWWSCGPETLASMVELWSWNTHLYGGTMVLKHSPLWWSYGPETLTSMVELWSWAPPWCWSSECFCLLIDRHALKKGSQRFWLHCYMVTIVHWHVGAKTHASG